MTGLAPGPSRAYKKTLEAWQNIAIPGSFSSRQYFERGAAGKKKTLPTPVVDQLKQSLTYQSWKRPVRNFQRRTYPSLYFSQRFEADTVDLGDKLDKLPEHRYILLLIDVFSRKLFTSPLRNKKGSTVKKALSKTFRNLDSPYTLPHLVEFDLGKEYDNAAVRNYLRKRNVPFRFARGANKARYAERAVRSFKRLLSAYWQRLKQLEKEKGEPLPAWHLVVRRATKNLNNRLHASLGCSPNEMTSQWQRQQNKLVLREVATSLPFKTMLALEGKGPLEDPDASFAVGDRVLPLLDTRKGRPNVKESSRAFKTKPHRVVRILKDKRPYLYQVAEEDGGPVDKRLFYAPELRPFLWDRP